MALLQRFTTPLLALLPDMNNVPQKRQAVGGIVASVVAHLLLLLLFIIGSRLAPEGSVDFAQPKPDLSPQGLEMTLELTEPDPSLAELLTPEELKARAERPIIDSTGLAASKDAPKEAIFESDQNMKAASEKPPTGDLPLPSQEGRDLPFMNFKDQESRVGSMKAPPSPTDAVDPAVPPPKPMTAEKSPAQEPPAPEAATAPAKPTPPPVPEVLEANETQIAIATKMTEVKDGPVTKLTPATPAFRSRPLQAPAPARPEPMEMAKLVTPAPRADPSSPSGFQEEQIKTRVEGSISNRGANSVDAVKTPLGVYFKQVKAAIASRWYFFMKQHRDLYAVGSAKISFSITKEGRITGVRIAGNSSNAAFGMMCQQAVAEAEIAPPPEEANAVMEDGKLEHDFTFNYVPIQ